MERLENRWSIEINLSNDLTKLRQRRHCGLSHSRIQWSDSTAKFGLSANLYNAYKQGQSILCWGLRPSKAAAFEEVHQRGCIET